MSGEGKTIVQALTAVMQAVQAVHKNDQNTQQGFSFRGIDSVVNAVGPALREHGVVAVPVAVKPTFESYQSRGGAQMRNTVLEITWRFYGPMGDHIEAMTLGEASDAGDKSVPKAHSVAYRTLLLQALCIPTDEPDPDASVHERGVEQETDPRAEGWRAVESKGHRLGLDSAAIRGDYRAKMGHEIDGPESSADTLRDYYRKMGDQPAAPTSPAADPWQTPAVPDSNGVKPEPVEAAS